MYQAPSAPLSIGGVLDSGFTLFRECFTQVFLFAFATSLITAPASYLAPYIQTNGFSPALIGGLFGGGFVLTIVTMILTSAMIVRVDAVARGEPVSAGEALARGARRAPSALRLEPPHGHRDRCRAAAIRGSGARRRDFARRSLRFSRRC